MTESYQDLDINARINLKGLLADWVKYTTLHLQDKLERVVYNVQTAPKSGVQRSRLGANYRFGQGNRATRLRRTNALRRQWWQRVPSDSRVVFEFLQYGRYLDMGVGRGVSLSERQVRSRLRLGGPGRQRKPWYAKTKTHEILKLGELLQARYSTVPIQALESALNMNVSIPL